MEQKELIDFFHYNTTNYSEQLKYEKGNVFGYDNKIHLIENLNDISIELSYKEILPNLSSKRPMSAKEPLHREQLLNLLYNSYRFKNDKSLKAPSAGGIYPLELYVVIQNVEGIEKGVYHYNREEISLNFINGFSNIPRLNVPSNNFTENVGCMIFFVCNITNMMNKYGARGYRYCLIECGHIGQNISIVSDHLNIKSCAIGGFYDARVKKHLNLSDNFYPLYSYVLA